jgi:hypothetical protein
MARLTPVTPVKKDGEALAPPHLNPSLLVLFQMEYEFQKR